MNVFITVIENSNWGSKFDKGKVKKHSGGEIGAKHFLYKEKQMNFSFTLFSSVKEETTKEKAPRGEKE